MTDAHLPERSLIRISGGDAESFLQNLITTDIAALPVGEARPGALLTPQGKILFDFLIWRDGDGYLLEADRSQAEALAKRLTMYRLRAAVDITPDNADGITVSWGDSGEGVVDGRFAKAGIRLLRRPGRHSEHGTQAYEALRITAGIAQAGADFPAQDAFPHDALLDLNGGLSFRKGCYVGQEVVSRMQHRGTARRRVAVISADQPLPPAGTELTAGGKPVGTLGSTSGGSGLAIVRIDRVGDAMAAGIDILAGETAVQVHLPDWTGLTFPAAGDEALA